MKNSPRKKNTKRDPLPGDILVFKKSPKFSGDHRTSCRFFVHSTQDHQWVDYDTREFKCLYVGNDPHSRSHLQELGWHVVYVEGMLCSISHAWLVGMLKPLIRS